MQLFSTAVDDDHCREWIEENWILIAFQITLIMVQHTQLIVNLKVFIEWKFEYLEWEAFLERG